MSKKLVLFDQPDEIKDSKEIIRTGMFQKGLVDFIDSETGIVLGKRRPNKVVISGSAFTAAKHFNKKMPVTFPSYNTMLQLDNSVVEPYDGDGIRKEEQIYLFCVGTDGCGAEASQVKDVDYTKPIMPESIVPFRYVTPENDLGASLREKYYGRKSIINTSTGMVERYAYYFKEPETDVEFVQQYSDGTPVDENVFLNNRPEKAETYAKLLLKITKDDIKDFFKNTTGIKNSLVNSLSICTAWKKEIDGQIYYQDIRPLTKINFSTEYLIEATKGLDIIYYIFY